MVNRIDDAQLVECVPSLMRFANSLTRNSDSAADLVQDSVERALSKAHLFDGTNLQAWLNTICRRVFLNDIRRKKVRGYGVSLEDAPPSRIAVKEDQYTNLCCRDVIAAFEQLKLRDKVVLSLVVFEGMKYHEVAEILDIPIGTVRSRLSRARGRLVQSVEQGTAHHAHSSSRRPVQKFSTPPSFSA